MTDTTPRRRTAPPIDGAEYRAELIRLKLLRPNPNFTPLDASGGRPMPPYRGRALDGMDLEDDQ